uniref:Uncharacterized protein n=1 Tax=Meloidogyne hapla TaxID=6305 RepID=A0A1I8BCW2_MELHA
MPTCNQQKRLLLLWLSCRSRRVQLADVVKNVFLIRKGLISIINLMASINQKIKNETDDFIPMDSDNDGFSVPMRRYPITTAIFDFKPSTELEEKV